jgi:tRNA/tmRNA/rRNA uracil-C5-methylase (TrmA/RlmC/RlmD family)
MTRRPRQRVARGASHVGERHTAQVGPIAHGGHCVARLPDGRVVFVRHAIPGEEVVLEVTEGTDGDRFWRADAVEVVAPSPDRVVAPCPVAGPGLCGGCDFQHVSLARQRSLKAEVVASSCGGWPESTFPSWWRQCPATPTGFAGAPAPASPTCPTDALRCASTAPTSWCRSATA